MSDDIGMNDQQDQVNNLPVFEKKQLLDMLDLQSPLFHMDTMLDTCLEKS